MTNEELYNNIKKLSSGEIVVLIFRLMKDEIVSYEDITTAYVEYLQMLHAGVNQQYSELVTKFTEIWVSNPKNLRKNIADTMQYLKDKGRVNITDEKIEEYRNRPFSFNVKVNI